MNNESTRRKLEEEINATESEIAYHERQAQELDRRIADLKRTIERIVQSREAS